MYAFAVEGGIEIGNVGWSEGDSGFNLGAIAEGIIGEHVIMGDGIGGEGGIGIGCACDRADILVIDAI